MTSTTDSPAPAGGTASGIAPGIETGRLVQPGEAGWDAARHAWNLAVDQRPAGVLLAAAAGDVSTAFRIAAERGWRVAPQSTGHHAGPLAARLEETLLVKTTPMRELVIDPVARVARLGGGVVWGEVTAAAAPYGLAPLAGSSPDVGAVGYLLGGGCSWLGRKFGLASSRVRSFDVVTPDGVLRHVDADHEPDLFFALRGGGGSFGVVTAVEVELFAVPEVYAGALCWPIERADEVWHTWRSWAAELGDDTTSCVRVLRLPPLPEIPEPLRGGAFAVVEVAHIGGAGSGEPLVAPLRALAPALDVVAAAPPTALSRLHMDPEHPVPAEGSGALLTDLPAAAVDAALAAVGPGCDTSLLSVEIRLLGGAIAVPPAVPAAIGHLAEPYLLFAVGIAPPPAAARVRADVDAVLGAICPWTGSRPYLNFAERPTPAEDLWPADTLARLRSVARQVDPAGVLVANHPLGALVGGAA